MKITNKEMSNKNDKKIKIYSAVHNKVSFLTYPHKKLRQPKKIKLRKNEKLKNKLFKKMHFYFVF